MLENNENTKIIQINKDEKNTIFPFQNQTPQSSKTISTEANSHIIRFPSTEEEGMTKNSNFNSGRWSEEEHQKFIDGILEYGNEWKNVQKIIKTRSSTQARSHAQKFFLRIKKNLIDSSKKNLKDFKLNDEGNINIEAILNYVIMIISNEKKGKFELNNNQKEKLISVINCKFYNDNLSINKNDVDIDSDNEKNMSDYYNDNISFKKKKGLNGKNKIFNIHKDISHRKSMEISELNFLENNNKNEISETKNCYEEMKEYFVRKKSLNSQINNNNHHPNNIFQHRERFNSEYINSDNFEFQKYTGNLFGIDMNIYKNFFPQKKRKLSEQISTNNNIENRKNTFDINFEEYNKDEEKTNNNHNNEFSNYYSEREQNNMNDLNNIAPIYEEDFDGLKYSNFNNDINMNDNPF
jgi:SHAQKYF class myb-like DNA-binding protein